jgi:predicted ATPase
MLTKLRLTGKYAQRVGNKRSRTFTFAPGVNLLVGPNGSGKSTILSAIVDGAASENRPLDRPQGIECITTGRITLKYFDFEKNNPRTRSHMYSSSGLVGFQVGAMFRSHGEVNRDLHEGLMRREHVEGHLVLLDEPDQALDFDGALQLALRLKELPAAQVIAAVHHPVLVSCRKEFRIIEMRQNYTRMMINAMRHMTTFGRLPASLIYLR